MGIKLGIIVPHGGELMPTLNPNAGVDTSLQALKDLQLKVYESGAKTLIVVTPHGIRIPGHLAIGAGGSAVGTLQGENGAQEALHVPVHRDLALRLKSALNAQDLPGQTFTMGASSGPASIVPLDWGAFIPIWHLLPEGGNVVVICPSREFSFRQLYQAGRVIADTCTDDAVFVASCDWSHAHREDGPYGYDPAAAQLDAMVGKALESENILGFLEGLDMDFVDHAKPDGPWQTAMLAGIQDKYGWHGKVLAYDRPTYFGMYCALFA